MGDINQVVEQQKVVNQYLEEKKTATDLFVEKNKGKWGMADDVDQRMAERDRLSQKDIALILEQRASAETNESKELKKAKPLFSKSKDEQSRGRFSKLKKAQRKKAAKDMKLVDKEKGKMVEHLGSDRNQLVESSYAEYISIMKDRADIKGERQDVTGYERRKRAKKNEKAIQVPYDVLEKDLDNLVTNMIKDLYLSGDYEPAKEFEDARVVKTMIGHLEQRLKEMGKSIAEEKNRRKNAEGAENGGWTEQDKEKLRKDKLMQLRMEMFTLHSKTMGTNSAISVEAERTHLKAMNLAMEQLKEDYVIAPSLYTAALIENLEFKIHEKEKSIKNLLTTIFSAGNTFLDKRRYEGLNSGIREIANMIRLREVQQRMVEFRKDVGDMEGSNNAKEDAEQTLKDMESKICNRWITLDSQHQKTYLKFLEGLGYDKDKVDELVKEQGATDEQLTAHRTL